MTSSTQDLDAFVREALLHGQSRAAIERAALAAGWEALQVRAALSAYAEVEFPVPVPRPRVQLSAREAFLYLMLYTALYLSAFHLGHLLFGLIERALPDPTDNNFGDWVGESIRWSAAYLVIAFPAFVGLAVYVHRDLARHPARRRSPVRRWLSYLTLYLGAACIVGDLIALVYYVLAGELTVRFILKVCVVLAIAGAVFGYYLTDLRREERQ